MMMFKQHNNKNNNKSNQIKTPSPFDSSRIIDSPIYKHNSNKRRRKKTNKKGRNKTNNKQSDRAMKT
jgi:hypothetical protein